MKKLLAVAMAVAFLVTGIPVASSAEKTKEIVRMAPGDEDAVVYFLRKGRLQAKARTMFVYMDEDLLGVLDSKTYFVARIPSGVHLLWQNWTKNNREVDLIPGRTYYFEAWDGFDELDEPTGEKLLRKIGRLASPKPKELKTAEKHIENRFSEAELRSEKKGRYSVDAVDVMTRPDDADEHYLHVARGTELRFELLENVSTYFNEPGAEIQLRVIEPLVVDGEVLLSEGQGITGLVGLSQKARGAGVEGELELVVPAVEMPDGSELPLIARLAATGRRRVGTAAAVGVSTAAFLGMLSAIPVMAIKGREGFALAGSEFMAPTRGDHWVDRRELAGPEKPVPPADPPAEILTATTEGLIKLKPHKRQTPDSVTVMLATDRAVSTLRVDRVGGIDLDPPIEPLRIEGTTAELSGMALARFMNLAEGDNTVTIDLSGELADDTPFTADAQVEAVLDLPKE